MTKVPIYNNRVERIGTLKESWNPYSLEIRIIPSKFSLRRDLVKHINDFLDLNGLKIVSEQQSLKHRNGKKAILNQRFRIFIKKRRVSGENIREWLEEY